VLGRRENEIPTQAVVLVEDLAAMCGLRDDLQQGGEPREQRRRDPRGEVETGRRTPLQMALGIRQRPIVKLCREAAEDLFLVFKAPVERSPGHPRLLGNILHRGSPKAVAAELDLSGRQDRLALEIGWIGHCDKLTISFHIVKLIASHATVFPSRK